MNSFFVLPPNALDAVNYAASWIGFATVVGLIGSAIVLRNRLNSIVTILIGYAGTIIGWSIAKNYFPIGNRIPENITWKQELLSPATFLIAVVGTTGLLFLYKIIGKQTSKGGKGTS